MTVTPLLPVVSARDGRAVTSSTDVARYFEKRHDHILRDIENIVKIMPSDRLPNFGETFVQRENPTGGAPIKSRAFEMDRDGFTLLAMGFTGPKALKFKLRYIDAFNAMEAELGKGAPAGLPSKEARLFLRQSLQLARMAGLEKAAAAHAASRATKQATGFDFLAELGVAEKRALPAPPQPKAVEPEPASTTPPAATVAPRVQPSPGSWIRWYPSDALRAEAGLALHTRGALRTILDMIYISGGALERNDRYLAGMMGCSLRMARVQIEELLKLGCLVTTSDKRITSARAEKELKIRRTW